MEKKLRPRPPRLNTKGNASLKKSLPVGFRLRRQCPECGNDLVLRMSKSYGLFYGCLRYPQCPGTHSAHQNTGQPMGIPATTFTKKKRILAHKAFDTLLASKKNMPKKEAYLWLSTKLNIKPEKCHFALFDEQTCDLAIAIIKLEVSLP